jgi:hypothetical protein
MGGVNVNDNFNMIQFIDSDYRELFKIPDGGSIRIVYPPDDGRGIITRECKYHDSHHFSVKGGDIYHIAQFAEIMERIGARYEPEVWLWGVEVEAFAPGEEKYCTYNREEGNTCVGHLSGDFGRDGDRFHSNWYNHKTKHEADWSETTPEFRAELNGAVYALRQSLLKDYDAMSAFCKNHPEAKLPDRGGLEHYGFKLDAADRKYFILCVDDSRDSRFIVYAYDNAAPVRAAERQPGEKPSVLKQIRDAEKAPKPPRKPKTLKKQKDGEEL